MNIGYLLFMGLLCTTLTLWAIVAIRDDGQSVVEDEDPAERQASGKTDTSQPDPDSEDDAAKSGVEID